MTEFTSVDRYAREELGPGQLRLLKWVDHGKDVLEFGPSTGYMSEALEEQACTVTAVEIDVSALAALEGKATNVLWGDLDDLTTLAALPRSAFDTIIFADVLEHLRRPDLVLAWTHQFLRPGGQVLVSLPNVAFWRVRTDLARGQWNMTKTGILDETHLRFYTRESAEAMFQTAGYNIGGFAHVWGEVPLDNRTKLAAPRLWGSKAQVNGWVQRRWPSAMAFQYLWDLSPVGAT